MKTRTCLRWLWTVLLHSSLVVLFGCTQNEDNSLDGVGSILIDRDTTWTANRPILIEGSVNIEGATLTIAEGTTVRMGANAAFIVGERRAGGLRIQGTQERPVRILPKSTELNWRGIHVVKSLETTHINYLDVEQAGNENTPAMSILDLDFPIHNTQLIRCGGDGIEIAHVTPSNRPWLHEVSIQTDTGNPLSGQVSLLLALDGTLRLTAPHGGIYLRNGTLSTTMCYFYNYSCPYIIHSELLIDASIVDFAARTRIEFERDGALNFGVYQRTAIHADGVTFTARARRGLWKEVIVNDKVVAGDSYFRHCLFEFGGAGNEKGSLVIYGVRNLEVSESIFAHGAGYGIVLVGAASVYDRFRSNIFDSNYLGSIDSRK